MTFQDEELKEFLNIFKEESDEFIGKICGALNNLKNNPSNNDILSELLYNIHSLKSLLGAAKFNEIQKFVHNIEDILLLAKNNEMEISDNFLNFIYYLFNFIEENIKLSVIAKTEKIDSTKLQKLTNLLEEIKNNKSVSAEYYENITIIDKSSLQDFYDITTDKLHCLLGEIVQNTAEVCGKQVDLEFSEKGIFIDKRIICSLKNVFIHILKNSVYHSIENPKTRIKLGKSPTGKIQININNTKDSILIEINDNGQGFNIQKIKDKAIQSHLFTEDKINNLSDEELINLTFLSGFSTSDEATVVSGQGIGMNIIQNEIAQLNGSIKIFTNQNNGAKFQIIIPN